MSYYGDNADGPVVSMVTSSASSHYPAAAILDGRSSTFWLSGGLFPQQLVISLPQVTQVSTITITCLDVRRLEVEASQDDGIPLHFKSLLVKDLDAAPPGRLQKEQLRISSAQASHLRLTIHEGYDHFVAIQSVLVK